MIKILLVEDEKIELDTLRNYVDWEGAGIDKVFTARGGRSALECINEEEPDILFTDIQMPGISGIELVEIIRQEGHNCKVVFLTGYDRFEYAKEAIRLHVDEFLLKPFQVDEVEAVARKLVQKIETERKEKAFHKLALGKLLEKASHGNDQDLWNTSEYYFQKPLDQVYVNIIAFHGISETGKLKVLAMSEVIHAWNLDELYVVMILAALPVQMFRSKVKRLMPAEVFQSLYSERILNLSKLKFVCDQMKQCGDDLFYEPSDCMISCEAHKERMDYEDRMGSLMKKNLVLEAILAGDETQAVSNLLECLEQLTNLKKAAFCQNAFSLYLYIQRQLENVGKADEDVSVPNILNGRHYEEIKTNLVVYVVDCCEAIRKKSASKWSSYVKSFVMKHYMDDCTVEEMAEGADVTPNYLRRKFKEETGLTILEYLTETRLVNAARMLENKGMKVKEISRAVGYPNISYFTHLFAKKYGVTPNEYKKRF